MQLYVGTSKQFVADTTLNQITDKMKEAHFNHYGFRVSPSEASSWNNSLKAMALVVTHAGLDDSGVLLEYQLPMSSRRIDCVFTGHDARDASRAVLVELKQWERCDVADGDYVVTWIGGGNRDVLHPSAQCDHYRAYLQDSHEAFYGPSAVTLDACSYLHNYGLVHEDVLLDLKYEGFLRNTPLFSKDQVSELASYLQKRLERGDGNPVLDRIMRSRYRPSRRLMEHVGGVIRHKKEYVLLDEQLVVFDKIMTLVKKGVHLRKKQVLIVKGGPGTGKSVIALNVLAALGEKGHSAHYVTGSKAFTETLRSIIGSQGSQMFRYFNSYTQAEPGVMDVLILDEAHRIRKTSANQYTPKAQRTNVPQVLELLNACKAAVFFIDDRQLVRPGEIGSAAYIRQEALATGADVHEFELDIQFRCGGSDAFLQWVDNTLDIRRTPAVLWEPKESFDFRIMDTVQDLDREIKARLAEGHAARLTAGFCWPWSEPKQDGTLVDDVQLDGFSRPWNAKPDAGRLAPGIPKSSLWAYEKGGVDQVGCVYTAQGFEFDYAGVIFGLDLVYDWNARAWIGQKSASYDAVVKRSGDAFTDLVKNTYRVLLSRGLKGCYVHFADEGTRRFVQSRMR